MLVFTGSLLIQQQKLTKTTGYLGVDSETRKGEPVGWWKLCVVCDAKRGKTALSKQIRLASGRGKAVGKEVGHTLLEDN